MKTLKNILTAAILSTSIFLGAQDETKEESKQILKTTLYNFIRKEKQLPTFETIGNEINNSKKQDSYSRINYQTKINKNIVYFLVRPEKLIKDNNLPEYNNYLGIMESSKLIVLYDKNSKIIEIRQQGKFIKQNPWKKEKIICEEKGLIEVEKHDEAKIIFDNAQKVLDYLVAKVPFNFQEKYNNFIDSSKEKEKQKIKNIMMNFKEELNFDLIPLYIPDKLTGQKMIDIDYEIIFEKSPKRVMFYSIINFEDGKTLEEFKSP